MTAIFRAVYPELGDQEFDKLIRPLDGWDSNVLQTMRGPLSFGGHAAWIDADEEYPFQQIARSLAVEALTAFPTAAVERTFADPTEVVNTLLSRLENRLSMLMLRGLVAGINNARSQDRLVGETSTDRYRYFLHLCRRDGIGSASGLPLELIDTYRRRVIDGEISFLAELSRRVHEDRRSLEQAFAIPVGIGLVNYGASAGDTHHHGRSVTLLTFADGTQLAYKPRDISCEEAFESITARMNTTYGTRLSAARTLRREGYGYVEFVGAADPSSDLPSFFEQCGQLGAVFYLLNGRDMHLENIIASEAGPVPIDLETIMHPPRIYAGSMEEVPGNAHSIVGDSISSTGLLPLAIGGKDDEGYVDLGFLGEETQGLSPLRSLHFERPFTDEVTLHFRHAEIAGREVTFAAGIDEHSTIALGNTMADAFEGVLTAALETPEQWLSIVDDLCSDLTIRYIHNATMVYARMLRLTSSAQALCRPDYTVALLKRMALFSGMANESITASEILQIAERDVPYFTVSSTSRDLLDGDGRHIGARFAVSPLDEAKNKFREMTPAVIKREGDAIRLAFVGRFPDEELARRTADWRTTPRNEHRSLAGVAYGLAQELADTVLPDRFAGLPKTWIGPLASTRRDRPWSMGVLGFDLYTGRTGPALALLASGRVLDQERFTKIGSEIFDDIARSVLEEPEAATQLSLLGHGAYTGLTGLTFALECAGSLYGKPTWRRAASRTNEIMVDRVRSMDVTELDVDVINGLSGILMSLRSQAGQEIDELCVEFAQMLTRRLLAAGDEATTRLLAQSGFAHGTAGALYALCQVAERVGHDPVVAGGIEFLWNHLATFFEVGEGRWASNDGDSPSYGLSWCHGVGGISLALDSYATLLQSDRAVELIGCAGSELLREGFGRNLTWCHGDLGNYDALKLIAPRFAPALEGLQVAEQRWLFPENIEARTADRDSRYSYANALMVGSAGVILHILNRLDETVEISPARLTFTNEVAR